MNDALARYARRARGDDTGPQLEKFARSSNATLKLSIVHAHAEASKSAEALRKIDGEDLRDGARKT